MSARKMVVFTTLAKLAPAAASTAPRLSSTCRVCAAVSPSITVPVAGSSAICPLQNTIRWSPTGTTTAWEYGPIAAGVRRVRRSGRKVAQAHLHYLNPFPRNTGEVLRSYERVLVPEMNLGQLLKLVRAEFLVDAVGFNRVRGVPLRAVEIEEAIEAML